MSPSNNFDESKHPRAPKGASNGGKFVSKSGSEGREFKRLTKSDINDIEYDAGLDHKSTADKPGELDTLEKKALKHYVGVNSEGMNVYARFDKEFGDDGYDKFVDYLVEERGKEFDEALDIADEIETQVMNLDKAIDTTRPIGQDIFVFRGMATSHHDLHSLEPGDTFFDNGFHSTSMDSEVARRFTLKGVADPKSDKTRAVFEIKLKAEQKALVVDGFAKYDDEREVILPRGTGYQILSKRIVKQGLADVPWYEVELVTP